jgi:S-methyl-5-thioribose kinase
MMDLPTVGRFVGGAGYAPLNKASLLALVSGVPACMDLLKGDPADWEIREVGDGNLNLVFIVTSGTAGVVVKQALPYVRLVGESWPLPLDRAHFERAALETQAAHVPMHVPKVYHFDAELAAIVMAYLSPHIILRKGLIRRVKYPQLADHLSTFMAEVLFRTSDLAMPADAKKAAQTLFCQNTALCKISEDLIFTDPYRIAPLNRWTSPELDGLAAAFRADAALKVAVQELKWAFLTRGEALLHGDLHTGSVMVTDTDTRVIDPEFAFFGPIGFDIGAVLANLMLSYVAQDGHPGEPDPIAALLEPRWRSGACRYWSKELSQTLTLHLSRLHLLARDKRTALDEGIDFILQPQQFVAEFAVERERAFFHPKVIAGQAFLEFYNGPFRRSSEVSAGADAPKHFTICGRDPGISFVDLRGKPHHSPSLEGRVCPHRRERRRIHAPSRSPRRCYGVATP